MCCTRSARAGGLPFFLRSEEAQRAYSQLGGSEWGRGEESREEGFREKESTQSCEREGAGTTGFVHEADCFRAG